jgi:hypothetical protein
MFFKNKLSKFSFYGAILLVTFFTLAPVIFAMPPVNINPDTYVYISIANYYIFESPVQVLDAYTVGAVIPLVIAAAKFMLMCHIEWDFDADILLVKSLAVLCYVLIFIFAAAIMKKTLSKTAVFNFILLSLLFFHTSMDTLSLNGELVSVVLLLLLVLTFRIENLILFVFAVSFVSFLILNTKIQSIIFLGLLLIWGSYEKRVFKICKFSLVVFTLLILDLLLYVFDLGIIFRLSDMLVYSGLNNAQSDSVAEQLLFLVTYYLSGLKWAISTAFVIAPLILFIVCCSVLKRRLDNDNSSLIESPLLWFCVLLITIITPGNAFEHYAIYAIFYSVFMFPKAIENLTRFVHPPIRYSAVILPLLLVLLVFKSIAGAYSPAIAEEDRIYPVEELSSKIPVLLDMVSKRPGKILVHGWDYRYYAVFSRGSFGFEQPLVYMGAASVGQYADAVERENYRYIIDVTGASGGYLRGFEHGIHPETIYGSDVFKQYVKLAKQNGVVLYERKDTASPSNLVLEIADDGGVTFNVRSNTDPLFSLVFQAEKFVDHPKSLKIVGEDSISNNSNWVGTDYQQTKVKGYSVLGSYVSSDSDVGVVELVMNKGEGIYYRSGPTGGRQSLTVVLNSGVETKYILPVLPDWTLLVFDRQSVPQKFEIKISDSGGSWGEWSAIALSVD